MSRLYVRGRGQVWDELERAVLGVSAYCLRLLPTPYVYHLRVPPTTIAHAFHLSPTRATYDYCVRFATTPTTATPSTYAYHLRASYREDVC
eukprot:1439202-Rhodomonas_salina.2